MKKNWYSIVLCIWIGTVGLLMLGSLVSGIFLKDYRTVSFAVFFASALLLYIGSYVLKSSPW